MLIGKNIKINFRLKNDKKIDEDKLSCNKKYQYMKIRKLLLFFIFSLTLITSLFGSDKKNLMLAKVYHADIDVREYLVSEKLDGVRARWDGKNLRSRNSKIFAAPFWFTANFPQETLDGELWSKRGDFAQISSIVNKKDAHEAWKSLKLWVFDLPLEKSNFETRAQKIRTIVHQANSSYLAVVEQSSVKNNVVLMHQFEKIIAKGGEGLMLHKKSAFYKHGRSNDLLKLKQYLDAEAKVLGYKKGKGRLKNMVGSLKVENDDGVIFFIGSGLTDTQRKNPPPIGSKITFRYQSFTKNGIPRFPVFLRIRPKE